MNAIIRKVWRQDKPVPQDDLSGYMFTPEEHAHTFIIEGRNHNTPVALTGTVTGEFLNQDGVTVPVTGTANGEVELTMIPECYFVPGRFELTIYVNDGEHNTCVYYGVGTVRKPNSDTITYPTAAIPDVAELIEDLEEVRESWPEDYTQIENDVDYLKTDIVERTLLNKRAASTPKTLTGNPLEIEDALPQTTDKVVVGLQPQQDLHGYDKPWVGGAGKNLLPMTVAGIKAANTSGTWNGNSYTISNVTITINTDSDNNITGYTVDGTASATIAFTTSNSLVGVFSNGTALRYNGLNATGSSETFKIDWFARATSLYTPVTSYGTDQYVAVDATLEGASESYTRLVVYSGTTLSNLKITPMLRLSTVTDATFEPYSNICPITGYDNVEVIRTGKNLFPGIISGKTLDDNTGEETSTTSNSITTFIRVAPNTPYTLSGKTTTTGAVRFFEYDVNKAYIGNSQVPSFSNNVLTIITGSNTHYIRMRASVTVLVAANEYQFEKGATATSYEPYQGQTLSVNLSSVAGGTVYGGTVTINEDGSGTLVVDRAFTTLGNFSWTYYNNYADYGGLFYSDGLGSLIKHASDNEVYTTISGLLSVPNTYNGRVVDATSQPNASMRIRTLDGRMYVRVDAYTDATSFTNALSDIQIAYILATPVTYPLTASQVTTLLGYNRIYTNGDTLEVTYRTDKYATKDEAYGAYATDTATGVVASFSDGADDIPMKTLTVAIEPVQDLHGYDNPWPAGGGKNKLPVTATTQTVNGVTFTVNDDGTIKVNGTATENATLTVYGANATTSADISIDSDSIISIDTTSVVGVVWKVGSGITFDTGSYQLSAGNTLTGFGIRVLSGATVNNVVVKPMLRLSTETDATYAPYTNICPISGWDEANVTRAGKNLLDVSTLVNGYISADGTESTDASYRKTGYIPVAEGKTYTFGVVHNGTGQTKRIHGYNTSGAWVEQISTIAANTCSVDTLYSSTFSIPSGVKYIKIGSLSATLDKNFQLEPGSTATAYEPYIEKTLSVNLKDITGSTVYGGTLTINSDGSGTVVVDMLYVKGSDCMWAANASFSNIYNATYTAPIPEHSVEHSIVDARSISSHYIGYTSDTLGTPGYGFAASVGNARTFYVKNKDIATLQDAVVQLANVEFAFPMRYPTTYALSVTQLRTLLGSNNVWADCGNVSVVYRADTGLYIDKKLSALMAAIVNS